jgi:hypothetical protein
MACEVQVISCSSEEDGKGVENLVSGNGEGKKIWQASGSELKACVVLELIEACVIHTVEIGICTLQFLSFQQYLFTISPIFLIIKTCPRIILFIYIL